MKRIYYGSITLDVSHELAALLERWIDTLENPLRPAGVMGNSGLSGGGYVNFFFTVPGYLNGADESTTVTLLLGPTHSIAFADQFPAKTEAAGTAQAIGELHEKLATDEG